ncbi:hypothetical protein IPG41_02460 [Candidatus Peregrinibacteria bacterium]|nr:MAG: hypothetical protein IPG41_02460 [Candidatus Peregrinibacteria bacterium]
MKICTDFRRFASVRSPRASALLLSFFLMSILILVAISVSVLVLRDMGTVRTIVGGTQAYYAAEGTTELGLYELKKNLPGYEPTYEDLLFLSHANGDLNSLARSGNLVVPCEDQGEQWHALAQNESVQIPLFAQTDAAGTLEPSDGAYMNFYVEFYAGLEEGTVDLASVPVRDVLRWKVLGRTGSSTAPGATEAMSEYIPLYNELGFYDSTSPTKFGTADLGGLPPGYQDGKFYSSSGANFDAGYPISTFLSGHVFNYLVLTNIVTESTENETIFYRFRSMDYEPVCEYVELAASGSSTYGSARQDLNTLVREGENLPVFDFVIYHTNPEETETAAVSTVPDWAAVLLSE